MEGSIVTRCRKTSPSCYDEHYRDTMQRKI
jgi:hypothetical protein